MSSNYPSLFSKSQPLRRFRPQGQKLLLTFIIATIILFGAVQLQRSVRGPEITFDQHIATTGYNVTRDNIFTLSGNVKHVAYFFLNEQEEVINDDDTFNFDLYMPYGNDTIDVRIVDRYGREDKTSIKVFNPNTGLNPSERESVARKLLTSPSETDLVETNEI